MERACLLRSMEDAISKDNESALGPSICQFENDEMIILCERLTLLSLIVDLQPPDSPTIDPNLPEHYQEEHMEIEETKTNDDAPPPPIPLSNEADEDLHKEEEKGDDYPPPPPPVQMGADEIANVPRNGQKVKTSLEEMQRMTSFPSKDDSKQRPNKIARTDKPDVGSLGELGKDLTQNETDN